jgi:hypothetical protein
MAQFLAVSIIFTANIFCFTLLFPNTEQMISSKNVDVTKFLKNKANKSSGDNSDHQATQPITYNKKGNMLSSKMVFGLEKNY